MRCYMAVLVMAVGGLLALPALAQPPEEGRDGGDRPRGAARERMMRAFDRDGDGRLNEEERDAMREQMGERFERLRRLIDERAERPREAREREGDRPRPPRLGREGRRGPRDGRPDRNLQSLFGWFDRDGDNMLSRGEFAELSQFVERRRPGRPGGPPDGPRLGRRGDGPPPGELMRRMQRRERIQGAPARSGPDRREREVRPDDDERPEARDGDERRRPEERRRRAAQRWRADQRDAAESEPQSERDAPTNSNNLSDQIEAAESRESSGDNPSDPV